jgi:hypothetical protein
MQFYGRENWNHKKLFFLQKKWCQEDSLLLYSRLNSSFNSSSLQVQQFYWPHIWTPTLAECFSSVPAVPACFPLWEWEVTFMLEIPTYNYCKILIINKCVTVRHRPNTVLSLPVWKYCGYIDNLRWVLYWTTCVSSHQWYHISRAFVVRLALQSIDDDCSGCWKESRFPSSQVVCTFNNIVAERLRILEKCF